MILRLHLKEKYLSSFFLSLDKDIGAKFAVSIEKQ